jgi:hypothetical protein
MVIYRVEAEVGLRGDGMACVALRWGGALTTMKSVPMGVVHSISYVGHEGDASVPTQPFTTPAPTRGWWSIDSDFDCQHEYLNASNEGKLANDAAQSAG